MRFRFERTAAEGGVAVDEDAADEDHEVGDSSEEGEDPSVQERQTLFVGSCCEETDTEASEKRFVLFDVEPSVIATKPENKQRQVRNNKDKGKN